jgi:hypothetical protein
MGTNTDSQNEYENLLAQWSDLESGLGIILSNPYSSQQFTYRVVQYDRWMQALLQRDPDVGLYLLFQLAGNSPVGYSASHALVCSVLCHLIATELVLSPRERDSLVRAALTMNIAMTAVQDVLATQNEKPSAAQQEVIRGHTVRGAMLLGQFGVQDEDWLDIVAHHHDESVDAGEFQSAPSAKRLSRILKKVDRYAAMISPRGSRSGRSATESVRVVMAGASEKSDLIGHALVRSVGLCPPGTYVRMDSEELGVVVRRSRQFNQPYVAIVGRANGELMSKPELHATASGPPHIRSALPTTSIRAQLNHHRVIQLGVVAASG